MAYLHPARDDYSRRPRSRYFRLLTLERAALQLESMSVIWGFLKQSPGHLKLA